MSVQDRSVPTDDEAEVLSAQGGVRWKRFAGMLTITGAAAAAMVALTAQGVLAANFSISGHEFVITADGISRRRLRAVRHD